MGVNMETIIAIVAVLMILGCATFVKLNPKSPYDEAAEKVEMVAEEVLEEEVM